MRYLLVPPPMYIISMTTHLYTQFYFPFSLCAHPNLTEIVRGTISPNTLLVMQPTRKFITLPESFSDLIARASHFELDFFIILFFFSVHYPSSSFHVFIYVCVFLCLCLSLSLITQYLQILRCPRSAIIGGDGSQAAMLCLLCGEMICTNSYCCRKTLEEDDGIQIGGLTQHSQM